MMGAPTNQGVDIFPPPLAILGPIAAIFDFPGGELVPTTPLGRYLTLISSSNLHWGGERSSSFPKPKKFQILSN